MIETSRGRDAAGSNQQSPDPETLNKIGSAFRELAGPRLPLLIPEVRRDDAAMVDHSWLDQYLNHLPCVRPHNMCAKGSLERMLPTFDRSMNLVMTRITKTMKVVIAPRALTVRFHNQPFS